MANLKYLLDTNIIIYYLAGYEETFSVFDKISKGEIEPHISIINYIECLSFPSIKKTEKKKIENLMSLFYIHWVDEDTAFETIKIRKKYGIKIPDAIIIATAKLAEAVLITRDEDMINKGIPVINPFVSNN